MLYPEKKFKFIVVVTNPERWGRERITPTPSAIIGALEGDSAIDAEAKVEVELVSVAD